jgi:hypothetical protein
VSQSPEHSEGEARQSHQRHLDCFGTVVPRNDRGKEILAMTGERNPRNDKGGVIASPDLSGRGNPINLNPNNKQILFECKMTEQNMLNPKPSGSNKNPVSRRRIY